MSTHQQLLYHVVFSTKNRKPYLKDEQFRENVFAYMAGTIKKLNAYAISIGGFHDHVHLLLRIPAKLSISDVIGRLKANTSRYINQTSGRIYKFGWQDGFGVFTVSFSQKDRVADYISKQVEHHSNQDYLAEYLELLNRHDIQYKEDYI